MVSSHSVFLTAFTTKEELLLEERQGLDEMLWDIWSYTMYLLMFHKKCQLQLKTTNFFP